MLEEPNGKTAQRAVGFAGTSVDLWYLVTKFTAPPGRGTHINIPSYQLAATEVWIIANWKETRLSKTLIHTYSWKRSAALVCLPEEISLSISYVQHSKNIKGQKTKCPKTKKNKTTKTGLQIILSYIEASKDFNKNQRTGTSAVV